jgi:hypothetical protein
VDWCLKGKIAMPFRMDTSRVCKAIVLNFSSQLEGVLTHELLKTCGS